MPITFVQLGIPGLSFCSNMYVGFVGQISSIPPWTKPTPVNNAGVLNESTVTVKVQLVLVPQSSLAVVVTMVLPIEKVLPLGGTDERVNGELQPPLAELVKNTLAPLALVAGTVKFEEQFSSIGGATTVTVKAQLVLVPQLSLAMLVTMVLPIGKVLPLGGVQVTIGVEQPPVAELV